jgi:hypothetical protein
MKALELIPDLSIALISSYKMIVYFQMVLSNGNGKM